MIYKIVMMSGQEIPLANEDEVSQIVAAANKGAKLIVTKYGVVNAASIDSIIPFKEKMQDVRELIKYGRAPESAEWEVLGESPFAKSLSVRAEIQPRFSWRPSDTHPDKSAK